MRYVKIHTLITNFNMKNLENSRGGVNLSAEKFNNK